MTGNVTGNVSGSAGSFTGSLVGNVTGTQGATVVANVGNKTAAQVVASTDTVIAATDANTASTLVKRDASGNFTATTITGALVGNASTATSATSVSGTVGVANGGTGANLSAAGSGYLKQSSSGAAVTVGAIPAADLPAMVGDSGSGGTKGAVPAPASGDSAAGKFLKADGTWTAPSGGGAITACPTGFTMIGTSGKRGTFCISTAMQTAATFFPGHSNCRGLSLSTGDKAFMCRWSEWYAACLEGGSLGMTGHREWVSEFVDNYDSGIVAGDSGCAILTNASFSDPYGFRCCVR